MCKSPTGDSLTTLNAVVGVEGDADGASRDEGVLTSEREGDVHLFPLEFSAR